MTSWLRTAAADSPIAGGSRLRTPISYGLVIGVAAAAVVVICNRGESLVAAAHPAPAQGSPEGPAVFAQVLIALAAVLITGLILGKLVAYLGQPQVIGEVLAGIILGPSLLGTEVSGMILPASVAPALGVIAQLGVVLYMFVVGLELHGGMIRGRAHSILFISHTGIATPFVMGSALALFLYPRVSSGDVSFTSFALFLGVAMSITAFPVLARILTDRDLVRTELGATALACAATGDITAWCLLAFAVAVAQAQVGHALAVTAGAIIYVVLMLFLVRPALRRTLAHWTIEPVPQKVVAVVFVTLLLSALATEWIGIHAIFGAFLLGAIIPHDSVVSRALAQQLRSVVTVLLLPAFFAFTGMRTRIDLVSGIDRWLICGLIIAVAIAGKFGGTLAAARFSGMAWRPAAALGLLMNTRGLMELIVLNVGLDLKIISPELFSMMVLMALVTTMMACPLLSLFSRSSSL